MFSMIVHPRSIALLVYPMVVYTRCISLLAYPTVVYTSSDIGLAYPMVVYMLWPRCEIVHFHEMDGWVVHFMKWAISLSISWNGQFHTRVITYTWSISLLVYQQLCMYSVHCTLMAYPTILYPIKALSSIFPMVMYPRFMSLFCLLVYPKAVYVYGTGIPN